MGFQGLIEKNSLGDGNVNTPTTIYILGYYTLYRLCTFRRVNSILTSYFVFGYNISYYSTLKLKKELLLFVFYLFSLL